MKLKRSVGATCLLVGLLTSWGASCAHLSTQAASTSTEARAAYRDAVVYEVYWRSFGHGEHGAQGIRARLPYLQDLGVTHLWITPFFKSPQKDGGYDVADYYALDPDFGTLEEFDALVADAKTRGMGIVVDMVLNHVSDQHAWFQDVLQRGRKSPYYSYFIWGDGRGPERTPDDKANLFEATPGSAWRFVPKVGRYALHSFVKEQLDVDWTQPAVREAMLRVVETWGARGVTGFRFDVIDMIDKTPDKRCLGQYLAELHDQVLSKRDYLTVGEMPGVTPATLARYTHPSVRGLNMAFNVDFPLITAGTFPGNPFFGKFVARHPPPSEIKDSLSRWQVATANTGGWNALYVGTHDWARVVSRFGADLRDNHLPEVTRQRVARLFGLMMMTHKGTPFIYQGEELGLPSTVYPSIEGYRDPESLGYYRDRLRDAGVTKEQALREVQTGSRDAARGPIPWDDPPLGAALQASQPGSVLHFYRRIIAMRQRELTWRDGDYRQHDDGGDGAYIYSRGLGTPGGVIAVANLASEPQRFAWPAGLGDMDGYRLELSSEPTDSTTPEPLVLQPFEARIYRRD